MFRRDFIGAIVGSIATLVAGLFGEKRPPAAGVGPAKSLPVPTPRMLVQSGYWRIVRKGSGEPDQLWYIPGDCIRPIPAPGNAGYPIFQTDRHLTRQQIEAVRAEVRISEATGRPLLLHGGMTVVSAGAYEIRLPGQKPEIVRAEDIIHIA